MTTPENVKPECQQRFEADEKIIDEVREDIKSLFDVSHQNNVLLNRIDAQLATDEKYNKLFRESVKQLITAIIGGVITIAGCIGSAVYFAVKG